MKLYPLRECNKNPNNIKLPEIILDALEISWHSARRLAHIQDDSSGRFVLPGNMTVTFDRRNPKILKQKLEARGALNAQIYPAPTLSRSTEIGEGS